MNKKVLQSMIFLCLGFLVCFSILKLFFAEEFVAVVNNERIVKAGQFIDTHIFLQQSIYVLTTFATYHFFLCACIKKWHLSWQQYVVLFIVVVATNVLKFFVPSISVMVNMLIMVFLPFILKADYKDFVTIFMVHSVGQLLVSFIRSQPFNLADTNTITSLICTIDMYIWLTLYYLYFNIYRENFFMGNVAPPFWGKHEKHIKAEIEALDKKIAVTKDEKKLAKYREQRAEYVSMLANTNKA